MACPGPSVMVEVVSQKLSPLTHFTPTVTFLEPLFLTSLPCPWPRELILTSAHALPSQSGFGPPPHSGGASTHAERHPHAPPWLQPGNTTSLRTNKECRAFIECGLL